MEGDRPRIDESHVINAGNKPARHRRADDDQRETKPFDRKCLAQKCPTLHGDQPVDDDQDQGEQSQRTTREAVLHQSKDEDGRRRQQLRPVNAPVIDRHQREERGHFGKPGEADRNDRDEHHRQGQGRRSQKPESNAKTAPGQGIHRDNLVRFSATSRVGGYTRLCFTMRT